MILEKWRTSEPSGDDTPEDWHGIAELLTAKPLQEWRELLGFMAKLLDPQAEDPVAALVSFLKTDRFEMQLKAATIAIPKNLPQGPFSPADAFEVRWRSSRAKATTLRFRLDKSATDDGIRDTKYRFNLEEGDSRISFQPGDQLNAVLGLTKGDKSWELIWSNGSTATYAFDALTRRPYLHQANVSDKGTLADGVIVNWEGKVPVAPLLLPDVRHARK